MIIRNVAGTVHILRQDAVRQVVLQTSPQPFRRPQLRAWRKVVLGGTTYIGSALTASPAETDAIWRVRRVDAQNKSVQVSNSDLFTSRWVDYAQLLYH